MKRGTRRVLWIVGIVLVCHGGLAISRFVIEKRCTTRAHGWCMRQLPEQNYHAYALSKETVPYLSWLQRQQLRAWLEKDLARELEHYVIQIGEQPPQDVKAGVGYRWLVTAVPWWQPPSYCGSGPRYRRSVCLPGLRSSRDNKYSKELLATLDGVEVRIDSG